MQEESSDVREDRVLSPVLVMAMAVVYGEIGESNSVEETVLMLIGPQKISLFHRTTFLPFNPTAF